MIWIRPESYSVVTQNRIMKMHCRQTQIGTRRTSGGRRRRRGRGKIVGRKGEKEEG